MSKKRIGKIHGIYIFLFLALMLMFIRLFYSVELTDEAYGIAEVFNASLGNKPIVDIWDPHTGWFLYAPFMMLYRMFVPSLSGVVLFFRILYFSLALLVLGISCRLFSGVWGGTPDMIQVTTIGCITYVSFSMPNMGYNAAISFLLILSFAILVRWQSGCSAFFLGGTIGVCCLTYPTFVVMAILMLPMLFIDRREGRYVAFYCLGVAAVGLLFSIWCLTDGTLNDILTGVRAIMRTPHEQNKGAIDLLFLRVTFLDRLKVFFTLRRSIIWIVYGTVELVIWLLPRQKDDRDKKNLIVVISNIVFIVALVIEIWCDTAVQPISRGGFISFCLWCSALSIMFVSKAFKNNAFKYLVFFSAGYILTYCFTSDNKNLFFGLDAAGTLAFFMWGYATATVLIDMQKPNMLRMGLCLPCIIGLMCFYGYVYRDLPVIKLDTWVKSGIYKGLITTSSNSEYVQQLEKDLQSELSGDISLCTVNNIPAVYLMAKKEICAPQTWDAQFLARGYSSSEPVVSYFEAKDKMPDTFIASDHLYAGLYERKDIELMDYISKYYEEPIVLIGTDGSRTMIWYKRNLRLKR